jgi:hypothetical protein
MLHVRSDFATFKVSAKSNGAAKAGPSRRRRSRRTLRLRVAVKEAPAALVKRDPRLPAPGTVLIGRYKGVAAAAGVGLGTLAAAAVATGLASATLTHAVVNAGDEIQGLIRLRAERVVERLNIGWPATSDFPFGPVSTGVDRLD